MTTGLPPYFFGKKFGFFSVSPTRRVRRSSSTLRVTSLANFARQLGLATSPGNHASDAIFELVADKSTSQRLARYVCKMTFHDEVDLEEMDWNDELHAFTYQCVLSST